MRRHHSETHYAERVGWLRAAVLGANDGLVSVASLLVGVAAADTPSRGVMLAGIAGIVAGAMSMAAGEYVSVSSQADSEHADLERERRELRDQPESERTELTRIYMERGLDPDLAGRVARQLMEHDALGAHARDELGLSEVLSPNAVLAAFSSGAAFSTGGALPLIVAVVSPESLTIPLVAGSTLVFLPILGGSAASVGGAGIVKGAVRVTLWGAAAMAATALIGAAFGTVV